MGIIYGKIFARSLSGGGYSHSIRAALGVPSFLSIWISVDMFRRRRLRRQTSVTFVTRSCIAARKKTVGAYKL